jgi:hypothetical protein
MFASFKLSIVFKKTKRFESFTKEKNRVSNDCSESDINV